MEKPRRKRRRKQPGSRKKFVWIGLSTLIFLVFLGRMFPALNPLADKSPANRLLWKVGLALGMDAGDQNADVPVAFEKLVPNDATAAKTGVKADTLSQVKSVVVQGNCEGSLGQINSAGGIKPSTRVVVASKEAPQP